MSLPGGGIFFVAEFLSVGGPLPRPVTDFWRSNTTTEHGPRRPRNHSRHRGKPQAAAAMQHGAINQQGGSY